MRWGVGGGMGVFGRVKKGVGKCVGVRWLWREVRRDVGERYGWGRGEVWREAWESVLGCWG